MDNENNDEFIFPTNLKPPSLGSRFKKQMTPTSKVQEDAKQNSDRTEEQQRKSEPVEEERRAEHRAEERREPMEEQEMHMDNVDMLQINGLERKSMSQNSSPSRSPIDPTPIVIHGNEISRDDFTPITTTDFDNDESFFEETRQMTKYQTAVSTDTSTSYLQGQPKITSPSSDISIDPRPIQRPNNINQNLLQIDKRPSTEKSYFAKAESNPPSPSVNKNRVLVPQQVPQQVPLQVPLQGQQNTQQKTFRPTTITSVPVQQIKLSNTTQGIQNIGSGNSAPGNPAPSHSTQTTKNVKPAETENKSVPKSDEPKAEKQMTQEELIARAHDYFLKYQILQKSWPEYKFPNLDENLVHHKPQVIIDSYTTSIERIQIDMDVSQYKIALIILFLVIEVVCVKFLGFDAGGYTLSQIKAMNRYEKLLIEIGERKLLAGGDTWPPEVKILFIGLFNCALFILMKYLSSILGPQLISYISPIVNGLFSGVLDTSNKAATLPDEVPNVPERQQDFSGMLGNVASMAANAFTNNSSQQTTNGRAQQKASRRPVYRD